MTNLVALLQSGPPLWAHHEVPPSLWPLLGHAALWIGGALLTAYGMLIVYLRSFR
jgi:hypothetical protein